VGKEGCTEFWSGIGKGLLKKDSEYAPSRLSATSPKHLKTKQYYTYTRKKDKALKKTDIITGKGKGKLSGLDSQEKGGSERDSKNKRGGTGEKEDA